MAISLTSRFNNPFSLLIVSVTSATLSAFRDSVPLKITSSIFSARSVFDACSPSTHFIASTTLLLPQPFGPSKAVIPSANSIRVLSANDLNPNISRLLRNTLSINSSRTCRFPFIQDNRQSFVFYTFLRIL